MPKPINPGRTIRGTRNDDVLQGTYGDDNIYGLAGNDDIYASDGADTLYGGDGNDRLFGQDGNDYLFGEAGDDLLVGGWGNDVLDGGGVYGGYDVLYGGGGNDTFVWGSEVHADGGVDRIQGADAVYLYASAGEGVTVSRDSQGHYTATSSMSLVHFDMPDVGPPQLYLTGGSDTVEVMPWTQIFAGAGDDRFITLADASYGLPGQLHGGDGSDFLELRFERGGSVIASGTEAWVSTVDAAGWGIGYAATFSVENWIGSDLRDTFDLTQAASGSQVFAGGGDDRADGSAFADRFDGGTGNDLMLGWAGDDEIVGNLGDDLLGGGDGADYLSGGDGNDRLYGGAGDDTLYAYTGDDLLDGEAGADILSGGSGADTLTGGSGADHFYFSAGTSTPAAPDTVTDFAPGDGDRIHVESLGTFEFVGSSYESNTGAQATLSASGSDTVLNLYFAGDAIADFTLVLNGTYTSPTGIVGIVDIFV